MARESRLPSLDGWMVLRALVLALDETLSGQWSGNLCEMRNGHKNDANLCSTRTSGIRIVIIPVHNFAFNGTLEEAITRLPAVAA